jgi:hypothetical protein
MRFPETQSSRSARLEERMGRPPWFETPRTRLRNLNSPRLRLLTIRAEKSRVCVKLIGIRFSAPFPKFA